MADDNQVDVDALLASQVVYDGEGYTRQSLDTLLSDYQIEHSAKIKSLAELSEAHDSLAAEMAKDLVEQRSAWDHLKNILTLDDVGANLKGLLERIPLLGDAVPERSVNELLEEKVGVAQRRVQEVANYLDTMHSQVVALQDDITRLNKKMVVAAINEEKAAKFILDLETALWLVKGKLEGAHDKKNAEIRALEAKRDQLKQLIWREGSKLRLYSNAEDRISAIIHMNNNFLEILTNLHGNMQTLYETGNEVLNELQGNLTALATAAKAADLSNEMQGAMDSLRVCVNKVTVLASETSLYLTQNVDRLASEMKIYDEETRRVVESNLQAEREIKEERVDETVELARTEFNHFKKAREDQ